MNTKEPIDVLTIMEEDADFIDGVGENGDDLREALAAVAELIAAVQDKRNADCGLPKSCGHTFYCVCPGLRLDAALTRCGVNP
jgi:hypothetical protein